MGKQLGREALKSLALVSVSHLNVIRQYGYRVDDKDTETIMGIVNPLRALSEGVGNCFKYLDLMW